MPNQEYLQIRIHFQYQNEKYSLGSRMAPWFWLINYVINITLLQIVANFNNFI